MSLNQLQSNLTPNTSADVYTDLNALQNLKSSARENSQAALPEVARQFESVMITMMIKNLRKTGMEDPIFKSQASDTYRDMYDQQLGLELSKGQGIGLAQSIVQQLQQQEGQNLPGSDNTTAALTMPHGRVFPDYYSKVADNTLQNNNIDSKKLEQNELHFKPVNTIEQAAKSYKNFESPEQFVAELWPLAEKAAKKLGVSAEVVLSQAALETGWGKHIIHQGQNSSFNLFNIKANHGWQGERMEKLSIEFVQGKAIQQTSDFRAYKSLSHSFDDYVNFLQNNPRYKKVLDKISETEQKLHDFDKKVKAESNSNDNVNKDFIKGLHKAGYATDPAYSDKVLKVLNSDAIQNQKHYQMVLASK